MIGYVRGNIRMLEVKKYTSPHFEAILMCVQHPSLHIPVQVIGLYVSPQCKYNEFLKYFDDFMRDSDKTSKLIVMEDFNMKSITRLNEGYDKYVKRDMKAKYNLSQIVSSYIYMLLIPSICINELLRLVIGSRSIIVPKGMCYSNHF